MDWSRFNKKPVRLGVHSGGARLREHRPPAHIREEHAGPCGGDAADEAKCSEIREQVAELEAKQLAQKPAAAVKRTVGTETDAFDKSPAPSVVPEAANKVAVAAPAEGSEAVRSLSALEMQIEKGAAVNAVEQYKGLTKSQRRAKRAKEEKAASTAAVGSLLVSYERGLKDKGTITSENLAEHILARNVHKRRENWYRETADRNWYRDYVKVSDNYHYDDNRYLDRKAADAAAERSYADRLADRSRESSYDSQRASYAHDSWKRDMDRRLDDVDYWRNRGYRD